MKKNPRILEIVKLTLPKKPVFLEVPVPEKSFPYLVGNPLKEGPILKWVEKPTTRKSVMSWGYECEMQDIISCMTEMIKMRGAQENWDVIHISLEQAVNRMKKVGIEDTQQIGQLLVPKDPSLLGSVLVVGNLKFPVIHNPSRGITFLSNQTGENPHG